MVLVNVLEAVEKLWLKTQRQHYITQNLPYSRLVRVQLDITPTARACLATLDQVC